MNILSTQSKLFFKRNAPTILTMVGGVGLVLTAIAAVKDTPKALKRIEQARAEKGEELTKLETMVTATPAYIPTLIAGTATLACMFGANTLNKRKQASLVSAYALLDNSYKTYRQKVEETYGDGTDKHIRQDMAKDVYEKEDITVESGKQLFYDDISMRYFESTMEDVIRAEYLLNRRLSMSNYVCLNEFYDLLKIPDIDGGDELGWSAYDMSAMYWNPWIEFDHEKVVMDDGLECYVITITTEPIADYLEY